MKVMCSRCVLRHTWGYEKWWSTYTYIHIDFHSMAVDSRHNGMKNPRQRYTCRAHTAYWRMDQSLQSQGKKLVLGLISLNSWVNNSEFITIIIIIIILFKQESSLNRRWSTERSWSNSSIINLNSRVHALISLFYPLILSSHYSYS